MKIQNFNAYSEFGFGSKSSAKRNRIFNFFSNFHNSTQPNRTSYLLDKALDTMDSNAKEALNRVYVYITLNSSYITFQRKCFVTNEYITQKWK